MGEPAAPSYGSASCRRPREGGWLTTAGCLPLPPCRWVSLILPAREPEHKHERRPYGLGHRYEEAVVLLTLDHNLLRMSEGLEHVGNGQRMADDQDAPVRMLDAESLDEALHVPPGQARGLDLQGLR